MNRGSQRRDRPSGGARGHRDHAKNTCARREGRAHEALYRTVRLSA